MFESNFPVDKQLCGYTERWNALSSPPARARKTSAGNYFI
jgi:hypothetical protein